MTEEAPETLVPASSARGGRELRLALAMRGGVSLAVWIGGAIAELDLARRGMCDDTEWPSGTEAEQARAEAYAGLLKELGYTHLVIDVLAGASAGGLNAIIYGFAQSVGTDLEWLRKVWEEQGDLWGLFHPQWDSRRPYRTEAVFDADQFFYGKVRDQLKAQAAHPRTVLTTDYLTVDLAATLQSGPPLPDLRTGSDLRPRTGHFRFRRTPAAPGPFNDMPARETDEQPLRRLAYAARATSSFPGAFEPAGVFSWEAQDGDNTTREPDGGDGGPDNMAAVFSEVAVGPTSTFDVMDGGVFDNIPIGRAIQAIADAPASYPTRRVLIYLDPSPPHPAHAVAAPKAFDAGRRQMRAWFVRSALTALRYKQTVESSGDDLRELNAMRGSVIDLQNRRRLFLDTLPGCLTQTVTGRTLEQRYRSLRAQSDAARLCALLVAPGVGFLRALVPSPPVATALGVNDVDVALAALKGRLAARPSYPCRSDANALVAATDLLVSWLRQQQDAGTGDAEDLAHAKMAVYRVRTYALYLRQRRERDAVIAALGIVATPSPLPQTVIDAEAVAVALWPDAEVPEPGKTVPGVDDLASEEGLWARALTNAENLTSAELVASVDVGWQGLCAVVNDLESPAARADILRRSGVGDQPGGVLTPALIQKLQMSASLALGELGTTAVPDFFTFSGDQTPLDPGRLTEVVRQGRAQAIDADIKARREPRVISDAEALSAASKLAGNQLANFAGFLSADWRTHDWQWGRLDAGAGLVGALRELHPGAADTVFAPVEALVELCYDSTEPGLDLNRRKLTPADLPPSRRFALGARLGLGLQRALWPLTPKKLNPQGFRLVDIPGVVALIALRPLLVLLPLLLRPPVLGGVIVAVAGAQHWKRETEGHPFGLGPATYTVFAAVALALLVSRVLALLLARRRWNQLDDEQTGGFRPPVTKLMARRASSGAALALVVLVLVLARLFSWSILWLDDITPRVTGFEAVVVLGLIVAGNVAARRTGATSVVASQRRAARDVVGLVTGGLLVLLTFGLAWLTFVGDDAASAARVATSVAVGGVVWAVHHVWAKTAWPEAMALLSGGATAWLLLAKPPLGFGRGGRFFGESWTESPWGPVLDIAVFLVIVAFVFAAGFISRWLTTVLGDVGPLLSLLLMLGFALWGAWQLSLAWGWLSGIPTGLVYGTAVAAATTLFAPFRDELEA